MCRKLLSAQGRGRYLLRLALSRKALPQFISHLLHTPRVLEVRYIDQIQFPTCNYIEFAAYIMSFLVRCSLLELVENLSNSLKQLWEYCF